MDVLGWLVFIGVVVIPLLFVNSYHKFRQGNRSRKSFLRSSSNGGIGFALLLQQAGERWLMTPADDVVAVVAFVILIVSLYAFYRGYISDGDEIEQATQN